MKERPRIVKNALCNLAIEGIDPYVWSLPHLRWKNGLAVELLGINLHPPVGDGVADLQVIESNILWPSTTTVMLRMAKSYYGPAHFSGTAKYGGQKSAKTLNAVIYIPCGLNIR